jgi:hypothetical protein
LSPDLAKTQNLGTLHRTFMTKTFFRMVLKPVNSYSKMGSIFLESCIWVAVDVVRCAGRACNDLLTP